MPGVGIVEGINDRANAQGALNFIDEAALDPYVFMRESYLQYRANLVNDGKIDPKNADIDLDAALDELDSEKTAKKAEPVKEQTKAVDPVSSNSVVTVDQEFQKASDNLDKLEKQKHRRKK